MASDRPDLIVGIDFGMTGTAVAYAPSGKTEPMVMNDWRSPSERFDGIKIPTMLTYAYGRLLSWGFVALNQKPTVLQEQRDQEHFAMRELFKVDFPSQRNAQQWTTDYLKRLREQIEQNIGPDLLGANWKQSKIKYVFSYPTTWNVGAQGTFDQAIKDAGYQLMSDQPSFLSLDEGSAAMVDFLVNKSSVRQKEENRIVEEELILMADVGGGTSDVSICCYQPSDADGANKVVSLTSHVGRDIGGVYIDEGFKRKLRPLLREKIDGYVLSAAELKMEDEPRSVFIDILVEAAMTLLDREHEYCRFKHGYRYEKKTGKLTKASFPLQFPLHCRDYPNSGNFFGGNKDSINISINIPREDFFEDLFKLECDKIMEQFENEAESHPKGAIKHIVLAGGLGSSDYVREYLESQLPESEGLAQISTISVTKSPRLAVATGLVRDQLLKIVDDGLWSCKANSTYCLKFQGGGKEKTRLILQEKDEVRIPSKTRWKQKVLFDTDGVLLTRVDLVKNDKPPPKRRMSLRGDDQLDWERQCVSVSSISDMIIKKGWREPSAIKGKKKKPYKAELELSFEFFHGAMWPQVSTVRLELVREPWHTEPFEQEPGKRRHKSGGWDMSKVIGPLLRVGAMAVGVTGVVLGAVFRSAEDI